MASGTDLVELTTASTAIEAEWLVGALRGLGVMAVSHGDLLSDEFAMSQKLMGLSGGVRVMVSRAELEAAREALAAVQREVPAPEDVERALADVGPSEPHDPAGSDRAPATAARRRSRFVPLALCLLLVAVGVLGWLALSYYEEVSDWRAYYGGLPSWRLADPLRVVSARDDGWQTTWRHNGKLASVALDRDGDGVPEETRTYSREGRLVSIAFDRDENGVAEEFAVYGIDGRMRGSYYDANQNGIPERFEMPVDGVVEGGGVVLERWLDEDENGVWERREFVDAESGTVLDAFEDRGRDGFERVESRR